MGVALMKGPGDRHGVCYRVGVACATGPGTYLWMGVAPANSENGVALLVWHSAVVVVVVVVVVGGGGGGRTGPLYLHGHSMATCNRVPRMGVTPVVPKWVWHQQWKSS